MLRALCICGVSTLAAAASLGAEARAPRHRSLVSEDGPSCINNASACQNWGASVKSTLTLFILRTGGWLAGPQELFQSFLCGFFPASPRPGTCDVHSGRCQCPPGYGGHLCEELYYPACRHTTEPGPNGEPPIVSCNFVGPQSCECSRECYARPFTMEADMRVPCFERKGLPPDAQLSDFPAEDEKGVVYYDDWMVRPRAHAPSLPPARRSASAQAQRDPSSHRARPPVRLPGTRNTRPRRSQDRSCSGRSSTPRPSCPRACARPASRPAPSRLWFERGGRSYFPACSSSHARRRRARRRCPDRCNGNGVCVQHGPTHFSCYCHRGFRTQNCGVVRGWGGGAAASRSAISRWHRPAPLASSARPARFPLMALLPCDTTGRAFCLHELVQRPRPLPPRLLLLRLR